MRILYDHQAFQMQYFGGVSKCFCELISHLPADVTYDISIVESNNQHLAHSGLVSGLRPVSMDHHTWNRQHPGAVSDFLYLAANRLLPLPTTDSRNRRATHQALRRQDFDVFHPTFFKWDFLPYLGHKPFVLTIHDMMPELYPQYYSQRGVDVRGKRRLAERADAIVAVSECTKRDAVRILGIDPDRITVIHHGGPEPQRVEEEPLYAGRYMLYVGARHAYKNFPAMVRAFAQAFGPGTAEDEMQLVCAGPAFTAEEQHLLAEHRLTGRVHQLRADDAQLANLYAHAVAYVYPSEYEGFGMPVLEAFAYGCPVIVHDASSLPEVAGEAAMYFRMDGTGDTLVDVLRQAAVMGEGERRLWQQRGYERLAQFSWQRAAQSLCNVYQSVL